MAPPRWEPSKLQVSAPLTTDGLPLLLAVPDVGTYEYNFFLGNRKLSTKDMNFSAEKLGEMGVKLTAATTDPALSVNARVEPN